MIYMLIVFCLWFGYWSAESGASLPWSHKWQNIKSYYSEIPELVIALSFATIGFYGFSQIFDISDFWAIILFTLFTIISYAGKQSATWVYLNWEGHKNPNTERRSTLFKLNNYIGAKMGYKLGDEGFSWVWAFTKGFITSLPVCCLAAIFQPLCREVASHAKGRLPGDPNTYMEFVGDGFAYAFACFSFLLLINIL